MFEKFFNKNKKNPIDVNYTIKAQQIKLTEKQIQTCLDLEFIRRKKKDLGEDITNFFHEKDSMFREAAEIIVNHQQASASLLQRRLHLGYNRAGLLIDQIEASGIIGPFDGSKARIVNIANLVELENVFESGEFLTPNCKLFKTDYLHLYENIIQERLSEWFNKKSKTISEFDKNKDGMIDVIEGNDFNKLLKKNQKLIIDVDRKYIQQFVKISNYIKSKQENIQFIFECINKSYNEEELNEHLQLLKNQIHTYELLLFHSINMIGAIAADDMITFYEIYESFDKLGIFNSNWENEVSEKLINIGDKFDDLLYLIEEVGNDIVNEISNLSYTTQYSIDNLSTTVSNQLTEIESSINVNNLLTGIQTYQMYKINKNTKSLKN
jgi:hypothetical protein